MLSSAAICPEVEGRDPLVVLEIVTGAILLAPPKFTFPPEIVLIKIMQQLPFKISLSLSIFYITICKQTSLSMSKCIIESADFLPIKLFIGTRPSVKKYLL
jgi:uncharacterized membrane protein YGL010W